MRGRYLPLVTGAWRLAALSVALWACAPTIAWSQTPSPLQEWQYSSGIILERLFESDVPKWRTVLGAGLEFRPLYEGSSAYRGQGGPVINVRYSDIAFFSVGEGLGWNILHGEHYRAGVALGYDLGRRESDDVAHLRGLGDIGRAPTIKAFASFVASKKFPLVMRADVRQIFGGGADGLLADFGAYIPLPGSSKKLFMFAGPSITLADRRYQQKVFGVTATQALASGYPDYNAHGGPNVAGFGFSATRFITEHWLINTDLAVNRLLGSASDSPITQRNVQGVVALSMEYSW
jgi:outer membrane scaffolding protein for murein synthesis (MipA/OmpV family)